MIHKTNRKLGLIAACIVISIAVVGYFVGLQAPMPDRVSRAENSRASNMDRHVEPTHPAEGELGKETPLAPLANSPVILATSYSEMGTATRSRMATHKTKLSDLKQNLDPLKEFTVTVAEKLFALQLRQRNRAFNGAPPTVPHPVEEMSLESCMACHGDGISTETLRVSKMPHQYLLNCTQCHVENDLRDKASFEFRESTFVGLPAPIGGSRAYDGAPPQIPHSTWMRVDCMSCHGFTGAHGIRTTHPWRQNCQQCHAPSSVLDQMQMDPVPAFLPPIRVN